MNILPAGLYKLKSDLSLNIEDIDVLKLIEDLKEEQVPELLETISVISSSALIVRDVDMFKMHYGIGYDQLYRHKVIAGKYKLLYKASHYNIKKVLKVFKKYLLSSKHNYSKLHL